MQRLGAQSVREKPEPRFLLKLAAGGMEEGDEIGKKARFLRYYTVFNVVQFKVLPTSKIPRRLEATTNAADRDLSKL